MHDVAAMTKACFLLHGLLVLAGLHLLVCQAPATVVTHMATLHFLVNSAFMLPVPDEA